MFEEETVRKIEVIYQKIVENFDPSKKDLMESGIKYSDKIQFFRDLKPSNIFGGYCESCQPLKDDDFKNGGHVPKTKSSYYYGRVFKNENLKNPDFVCFSRCGDSRINGIKKDGRIFVGILNLKQLEEYTRSRPLFLIEADKAKILSNNLNAANKEDYRVLFDSIIIPAAEKLQDEKEKNKEEQKLEQQLTIPVIA